jgi:predicted RNA-binding protein
MVLVYSIFLEVFYKISCYDILQKKRHLISLVRRITLNRHYISLEKFVTVHGLLSSFRFESVGSPINCHAPI